MPLRRARVRHLQTLILLGAIVSVPISCQSEPPTAPPVAKQVTATLLRSAVTDEVAGQIDESGQFVFETPRPGERPEITEQRARQLAVAFFKTREKTLRDRLPRDRGGAALSTRLSVCPRAFYAESGYERLPDDLPNEFRRAFGAKWIVGLCSGSEQQVVIAVAAEGTDLRVQSDGTLEEINGGDFEVMGVPLGSRIPALPENGAVSVSAPGFRVKALPALQRRANSRTAFVAEWVFQIERAGLVRGQVTGVQRTVDTLRYGPYAKIGDEQATDESPDFRDFPFVETLRVQTSETTERTWTLRRRSDVPYRVEPIIREQQ